MKQVILVMVCDACDREIENPVTDVSSEEGKPARIPWDFTAQSVFECECGSKYYTGDFEALTEEDL